MAKKNSVHDKLVNLVEEEFHRRGFTQTFKFREYNFPTRSGEIDLYAKYDEYILLVEVKSTDTSKSKRRAHRQLYNAEKYFFKNKRVFKFYVYENKHSHEYVLEWLKN